MLAIIWALEEWRHCLEGAPHKFEIWTDHEYFMSAKKLNRWQAHWSLTLARFDFLMHHRPGKTMGKLDALIQRADHGNGLEDNRDITLLTPNFFAVRAVEGVELLGQDKELLRLIRRESKGEDLEDAVNHVVRALQLTSAKSIYSSEWSEENGILYFHGKIYVPPTVDICQKIVALNHDSQIAGHPGRWKTLELISIGGHRCLGTLVNTLPPVTSASAPKFKDDSQLATLSCSQHPTSDGTRSVLTSLSNFRILMDMMQSWWWLIHSVKEPTSFQ